MIKRYAVSVGIAFAAALAAVALLTVVSVKADDPRKLLDVFGMIAFFAGACAAGIAAPKITDDLPAVSALICGGIYSLVIMTVSLFFRGPESRPFVQSLLFYVAGIALSAVLGLVFQMKQTGSKKTRKNLMKKMSQR